ncbi:MAG: hypothetical protein Kow0067_16740 [Coriobacteriia bacterium]
MPKPMTAATGASQAIQSAMKCLSFLRGWGVRRSPAASLPTGPGAVRAALDVRVGRPGGVPVILCEAVRGGNRTETVAAGGAGALPYTIQFLGRNSFSYVRSANRSVMPAM